MTLMTAPSSGNLVVPFRGPAVTPALSPAETQVFRLLATGLTREQAAAVLAVSVHTVKTHTCNVYARTGTLGLVGALWEFGWIRLPERTS